MLWIKSLHIIFVISWFAGLFYLPRIYVNLAMENQQDAQERLLLMAIKLYRFMTILAVPAIVFGVFLFIYYGIGKGPGNIWMHVKLALILLVIGYHHACGVMLKKFITKRNKRSHRFYRYFNEVAVILLIAIVILVTVKPF